ncbi:MAG: toxin-antitoxin system HicB family antitoxin [Acidimicrobiaceae bacterium]|nr:toxin-antitoxin system HicB family antitoxin [Acidimicrobiaceae bacterium]
MKQLLLRVPDEIHRRLAVRAARTGKSVNVLANEILYAAIDVDEGNRQARLQARAATLGILRPTTATLVDASQRRRTIESTKGTGPVVDQFLAEDRERI